MYDYYDVYLFFVFLLLNSVHASAHDESIRENRVQSVLTKIKKLIGETTQSSEVATCSVYWLYIRAANKERGTVVRVS